MLDTMVREEISEKIRFGLRCKNQREEAIDELGEHCYRHREQICGDQEPRVLQAPKESSHAREHGGQARVLGKEWRTV